MHFNALFLLCAFLAVCSEFAAYPHNEYKVRGRYNRRSEMNHISEADEDKHAADLDVPVPEVEMFEQEINNPIEKPVEFVHEPEVFVDEVPSEHQQEVIPHEIEMLPSKSEVPIESLASPLEHEELPILEEPVVQESAPKSEDLSVLYDYLYPMVLRKCLASAISSSIDLSSGDNNANYNHQMKYIDHPLVQISGLDSLEELRRNLTAVAVARRRFSNLPKMNSGCVFHFNEIDADMQAARDEFLMSHANSLSEEGFLFANKYILKHERLFKKDFMMHFIIRKLYELLRNHTSIYNVILALDADMDKYIKYWNTKH